MLEQINKDRLAPHPPNPDYGGGIGAKAKRELDEKQNHGRDGVELGCSWVTEPSTRLSKLSPR